MGSSQCVEMWVILWVLCHKGNWLGDEPQPFAPKEVTHPLCCPGLSGFLTKIIEAES